MSSKTRFIAADFIIKATEIHGNKYDYSRVTDADKKSYVKVEILCPLHGSFIQEAGYHIKGSGCPECGRLSRNYKLKRQLNVDEFIKASKEIHGDKYDYSQVVSDCYSGGRPMVTLICATHGAFKVNAKDHVGNRLSRCPSCSRGESYGEYLIRRYLENLNIEFIKEHTFDDLLSPFTGKKLRFDFFIPSSNVVIEFDGEYHFTESKWHHRQRPLNEIQFLDKFKEEYLLSKNIDVIRIHYLNRNPNDICKILKGKIK